MTDITPALRAKLDTTRNALLSVHQALLDEERNRYERSRGPIGSPGRFLQLVIHDPWFAWLHPITELVVEIDELLRSKQAPPEGTAEALLVQARRLLAPEAGSNGFQGAYFRMVQEVPAVALQHGLARKRLGDPQ